MSVTTAELATALIGMLEGFRPQAYRDSGGVWTVGFGETGPEVKAGVTVTYEQASGMLALRLKQLLTMVAGRPPIEGAALVSFGYDCGPGALANVLSGADTIDNPKHTTDRSGNVRGGLVARRRLERALILASRGE